MGPFQQSLPILMFRALLLALRGSVDLFVGHLLEFTAVENQAQIDLFDSCSFPGDMPLPDYLPGADGIIC